MEPFKNEKRTEGTSRPRPFASLQDALRAAQPSAGRLAARHAAGDGVALEPKVAAVTFRLSPNGDDWVVELQKGDLDFLNNLATEVGGFLRLFL